MKLATACFRIDEEVLRKLRNVAHRQSIREGREISWADLVRAMIEEMLASKHDRDQVA